MSMTNKSLSGKLDHSQPKTLLEQAVSFLDSGKFEESSKLAREIVDVEPNLYAGHLILGVSYLNLQKSDLAIEELLISLKLKPTSTQARSQLVAAYMSKHQYDVAAEHLEQLTHDNPDDALAFNNLGLAYYNSKRFELAEKSFERASQLTPEMLSCQIGLIRTYAQTGNRKGAEQWSADFASTFLNKGPTPHNLEDMGEVLDAYYQYMRIEDTEQRYASAVVPAIQAYYENVKAVTVRPDDGSVSAANSSADSNGATKVAFYIDRLSNLAHSKNLYIYISALLKQAEYQIEPYLVFYKMGKADDLKDLGLSNVSQIELPKGKSRVDTMLWLKSELAKRNIGICVTLGTISSLFVLTFACKVAPKMIWFSQKHHTLRLDNIDAYLTLGSVTPFRTIDNFRWRSIIGAFGAKTLNVLEEGVQRDAASIKGQLLEGGFRSLFGVIGREEKIDNDAYWDCVRVILERFPDARFIWSGRNQRQSILERIAARNLQDRCHFVGWVDTHVYVNVLDLYLDSFPFPGGHTTIEAMLAGTPVVSLITKDAQRITASIFAEPWLTGDADELEKEGLEPIFTGQNGEDLIPFVRDIESYIKRAEALQVDREFRDGCVSAGRNFVDKYLTNIELAGRMLGRHISEVAEE